MLSRIIFYVTITSVFLSVIYYHRSSQARNMMAIAQIQMQLPKVKALSGLAWASLHTTRRCDFMSVGMSTFSYGTYLVLILFLLSLGCLWINHKKSICIDTGALFMWRTTGTPAVLLRLPIRQSSSIMGTRSERRCARLRGMATCHISLPE